MKLLKKDKFRIRWIRLLLSSLGLFIIIIGNKNLAYNGNNWKGVFISLFGLLLLIKCYMGYEYLINEKQAGR